MSRRNIILLFAAAIIIATGLIIAAFAVTGSARKLEDAGKTNPTSPAHVATSKQPHQRRVAERTLDGNSESISALANQLVINNTNNAYYGSAADAAQKNGRSNNSSAKPAVPAPARKGLDPNSPLGKETVRDLNKRISNLEYLLGIQQKNLILQSEDSGANMWRRKEIEEKEDELADLRGKLSRLQDANSN